jgi:16S rRNA G1207 methylase RsmC
MPDRYFISYSSPDADFALELQAALEGQGNTSTAIPETEAAEQDLSQTLRQQLQECDVFVFVIPPDGKQSKWSLFELGAARALGRKIIAVAADRDGHSDNITFATSLAKMILIDTGNADQTAGKVMHVASAA